MTLHESKCFSLFVFLAHTLPNTKRFKLGAPTTFVTRSLANHGHLE
jgi:hypothetical protein